MNLRYIKVRKLHERVYRDERKGKVIILYFQKIRTSGGGARR